MSAPLEPREGTTLSGVSVGEGAVGLRSFLEVSGQEGVAIVHVFGPFLDDPATLSRPLERAAELREVSPGAIPMISWRMMSADTSGSFAGRFDPARQGGTLAGVARGEVDAHLIDAAGRIADWDGRVMLRPNWEMNAPWFPWGAFDAKTGSARPGNEPADYRAAWKRAHAILDGGPRDAVDARLREAGLPPLTAGGDAIAEADPVWIWAPAHGPAQPVAASHVTGDYYPGDAFVDWVGLDWYAHEGMTVAHVTRERPIGSDPVTRIDDFYNAYAVARGKPIALTEWGLASAPRGEGDDPTWMRDALAWMTAHPAVKAQVYFNQAAPDVEHRLESFPEAAAVFRSAMDDGRWIRSTDATRAPADSVPSTVMLTLIAVALLILGLAVAAGLRRRRSGRQGIT
ncbi:MAG: glycoside hydrolase family 26 protein [Dehalococcoidia bacterium]